jgi:hypothetical protein
MTMTLEPKGKLDAEVAQAANAAQAALVAAAVVNGPEDGPPDWHAVQWHAAALASLMAQAEQLLPQAVHDARDQELTWTQIGELLNTTAATAARRYRNKQRPA